MFFDYGNDPALRLFDADDAEAEGRSRDAATATKRTSGKALREGEPRSLVRGNPPR